LFGGEAGVFAEDDIDNLGGVLKFVTIRLVFIVPLLAFLLVVGLVCFTVNAEGFAETVALPGRLLGVLMTWALLVKELVDVLPHVGSLLTVRLARYYRNNIICLALLGSSRVVWLALVVVAASVVTVPLILVVPTMA